MNPKNDHGALKLSVTPDEVREMAGLSEQLPETYDVRISVCPTGRDEVSLSIAMSGIKRADIMEPEYPTVIQTLVRQLESYVWGVPFEDEAVPEQREEARTGSYSSSSSACSPLTVLSGETKMYFDDKELKSISDLPDKTLRVKARRKGTVRRGKK